jgi:protein phosphatase PTC6
VNQGKMLVGPSNIYAFLHYLHQMDGRPCQYPLVSDGNYMNDGSIKRNLSLGDLRFKKFGVTPEPEVRTKLLEGESINTQHSMVCTLFKPCAGKDWAYMVFVSDGVSSMLSDDEVVDLARDARDPKAAAEKILAFAQELGGDDNATAIVVPLAGWGSIRGPDKTKELRDYRRQQAGM